jgi:hypothetical protein
MLQHNTLEKHIKELGQLCLNITKIINKKKESSHKLTHENRIPRSLNINCELTTSSSYKNDPINLECKRESKDNITNFINQGLASMRKWSIHNIKLLEIDRCNTVLKKALYILEGIYSYWSDIYGPILPSGNNSDTQALLLAKIFLMTDFCNKTEDISIFFNTSTD